MAASGAVAGTAQQHTAVAAVAAAAAATAAAAAVAAADAEANAVNSAAARAVEDAMCALANAQATVHSVLDPDSGNAMEAARRSGGTGRNGNGGGMEVTAVEDGAAASGAAAQAAGGRDGASTRRRAAAASGFTALGGPSRPNKGLRHFSMKVCEKVESKGTTTYNEVADELVAELQNGTLDETGLGYGYDEKNIRRRVYDAINVLMALDIISKEKTNITWRGFPEARPASAQVARLQAEQYNLLSEVSRKMAFLSELTEQQRALAHLLERNGRHPEGATSGTALHLPFILVQSKPDATVEVQISKDMRDVQFNFFKYAARAHRPAGPCNALHCTAPCCRRRCCCCC